MAERGAGVGSAVGGGALACRGFDQRGAPTRNGGEGRGGRREIARSMSSGVGGGGALPTITFAVGSVARYREATLRHSESIGSRPQRSASVRDTLISRSIERALIDSFLRTISRSVCSLASSSGQ